MKKVMSLQIEELIIASKINNNEAEIIQIKSELKVKENIKRREIMDVDAVEAWLDSCKETTPEEAGSLYCEIGNHRSKKESTEKLFQQKSYSQSTSLTSLMSPCWMFFGSFLRN